MGSAASTIAAPALYSMWARECVSVSHSHGSFVLMCYDCSHMSMWDLRGTKWQRGKFRLIFASYYSTSVQFSHLWSDVGTELRSAATFSRNWRRPRNNWRLDKGSWSGRWCAVAESPFGCAETRTASIVSTALSVFSLFFSCRYCAFCTYS
jgi:hypothetical protein